MGLDPSILLRCAYFFNYLVAGAFFSYFTLYLHSRGIADNYLGSILALSGVAVLIGPLVSGHLADTRFSARTILSFLCLSGAAAIYTIIHTETVGGLGGAYLWFCLSFSPIHSLLNGMSFALSHEREARGEPPIPYVSFRTWGSVGFFAGTLIAWLIIEQGRGSLTIPLFVAVCSLLFCAAGAQALPFRAPGALATRFIPLVEILEVLRERRAVTVIGSLGLLAITTSIFTGFYARYLQEQGLTAHYYGLVVCFGVFIEWVALSQVARVHRWVGDRGIVLFAAGGMCLRLSILAYGPGLEGAIATQLFQAVAAIGLVLIGPMVLNSFASVRTRNSMQSLYSFVTMGVASILGNVFGGFCATYGGAVPAEGMQRAFLAGAILSAAGGIWWVLVDRAKKI